MSGCPHTTSPKENRRCISAPRDGTTKTRPGCTAPLIKAQHKARAQQSQLVYPPTSWTPPPPQSVPQGPPNGWYADPDGLVNIERFWDGTGWTEARRNRSA
jgi:Protein of unknown function (DUF2510)